MTDGQRVAVVTGAAGGIGEAAAVALAASGHRVARLDRAFAAPGASGDVDDALSLPCDIASADSVLTALGRVQDTWGRIGCLVNCAGIMTIAAATEITIEAWDRTLAVNVRGALLCAQAAFAALAGSPAGAIVNVTSISQLRGQPGLVAYAASKAALESLTRTLAVEWAPAGITVNAVAPGHVMTPMVQGALADGSLPQSDLEGWKARIPLGRRLAHPGEIADAIAFLAGPHARYVTGQSLVVDGALTINGSYATDPVI